MITQDRYNVAYILTEQSDDRPLREEFRKKLTEHRTYSVKKTIDYERSSLIPALLCKRVFAEFMTDQQRGIGRQQNTGVHSCQNNVLNECLTRTFTLPIPVCKS